MLKNKQVVVHHKISNAKYIAFFFLQNSPVTIHSQNIHRLLEIMKKILIIFYYEGKSSTICIESTVIKDERNIVRKTTKNSR